MSGLTQPYNHRRMTSELKADLRMWLLFHENFNGVVHIPEQIWFDSKTEKLFTDSAGPAGGADLGAACCFNGKWSFFQWLTSWAVEVVFRDMTFQEMVPVLLAMRILGKSLANKKVVMWIDNQALVEVLNRQTSKSRRLTHLVRSYVLITMKHNVCFKARYISS